MLATLLFATAFVARVQHLPVHSVDQPIVVSRESPQKVDQGGLDTFAYCDARGQSTIIATNATSTFLIIDWTLTAIKPGYPPDLWLNVSRVEPGQFEGWMTPAPYLHLDIRYDDDGLPTTKSIDAFCPATASQGSGLEE
ncbi:MAG: hypothetical protein ACHQJD_00425 [Thermoanaerobaculia bacterium]